MKVSGLKIKDMEMDLSDTKMGMLTRESFKVISPMEKGLIIGTIMKSTMENGKMDVRTVQAYGKELKGILMQVIGRITKFQEKVCIFGKMEINMKESGLKA